VVDFAQPILVVDDVHTMTRIVDAMLRKCGFSAIEQVHDAATALQRIKEQPFLFVLSDREMPDMTGIDLVRAVRADAKTAYVPFIMMSASNEPKDAEAAIAAGANTFITKPFSQTTLRDVIANLLRPPV
jgi:two-component system chemotaxis response regulator CheY